MLRVEVADLPGDGGLAGQRLPGEVLRAIEAPLGLLGELVRLRLQLVALQLDPSAAGCDVGDPAAYLRDISSWRW